MRCLLVRTPDKREYLTLVKNYPLLIEYANTFNARLYTVETVETSEMPPVLSVCELATALCEGEGVKGEVTYKVLKKHLPSKERVSKRRDAQKLAIKIREFIKIQLEKGKPLSLLSIKRHFDRHQLRTCTLSNHYAHIRRQLSRQGISVCRVGHGVYQSQETK